MKLREYTTIGIGGPADRLVFPRSAAQVGRSSWRRAVRVARTGPGGGINLLVADSGLSATVLCTKKHLSRWCSLRRVGGRRGGSDAPPAGRPLRPVRAFRDGAGLRDPGTVGGALSMNAGAYGQSIGEMAEWVEVVDAEGRSTGSRRGRSGSGTGRRNFRPGDRGAGRVPVRARDEGDRVRADAADERERRSVQPWGERTFGSAFRNPPGGAESAGGAARAGGDEGRGEGTPASPRSTPTSS